VGRWHRVDTPAARQALSPAPTGRDKFLGRYTHRVIKGGIGHNLPQEAPQAFTEAIVEVARY
jgi:hypothetical protein